VAESQRVRLGTRGSPLARWQADWVAQQLQSCGVEVQLVLIQTTGDVRTGPIGTLATQGVFTKEIQRALLDDRIDLAVHSLKDLPTEPVAGLTLAAVPTRAAEGDALLNRAGKRFAELPPGARIGTGSLRRRAQLLHVRPDLQLIDVRGNIDTRLQKLQAGEFDGLILAEAGLQRLELTGQIVEIFDKQIVMPAVGQGALGLEVRQDDATTMRIVQTLNDPASFQAVTAERALLARLRGGCLAPVGAWGRIVAGQLHLDAVVLDPAGTRRLQVTRIGDAAQAAELGQLAADDLLGKGAAELIAQARRPRGSTND
jgi:hydroxymethylbilane synthase